MLQTPRGHTCGWPGLVLSRTNNSSSCMPSERVTNVSFRIKLATPGCYAFGAAQQQRLIKLDNEIIPFPEATKKPRQIIFRAFPLSADWSMAGRDFVDQDKLILRGLQFHGFHGVKQEEKKLGQKFVVDVDAWLDLRQAGKSDDLADTVSYTDIYWIVKEIVEGPSQNLLESVAHLIANTTLLKFPQISAVRVKVGKPHVAVHGTVDYLGVEILRYKRHANPESV